MKKMFRATNVVLMLLCLMYFITYLDRVNVSTAAAGFAKEFDLDKTRDRPRLLGVRVSVPDLPDHRRLGQRPLRREAHADLVRR